MSNIPNPFASIFEDEQSSLNLQDLIAKGYLPAELPLAFTSKHFAQLASNPSIEKPPSFSSNNDRWTMYTKYSLARPGELRRTLAIINPLSFFRLADKIVLEQEKLLTLANPEIISFSHPVVDSRTKRALSPQTSETRREIINTSLRVGKRFCLKADVSQFYPSIYTHALDWAITGKQKAKANIGSKRRLGARIDKLVQACQAGQTRGLPIGPDTSLLLASIILSRNLSVRQYKLNDYMIFVEVFRENHLRSMPEDQVADFLTSIRPNKKIKDRQPSEDHLRLEAKEESATTPSNTHQNDATSRS